MPKGACAESLQQRALTSRHLLTGACAETQDASPDRLDATSALPVRSTCTRATARTCLHIAAQKYLHRDARAELLARRCLHAGHCPDMLERKRAGGSAQRCLHGGACAEVPARGPLPAHACTQARGNTYTEVPVRSCLRGSACAQATVRTCLLRCLHGRATFALSRAINISTTNSNTILTIVVDKSTHQESTRPPSRTHTHTHTHAHTHAHAALQSLSPWWPHSRTLWKPSGK